MEMFRLVDFLGHFCQTGGVQTMDRNCPKHPGPLWWVTYDVFTFFFKPNMHAQFQIINSHISTHVFTEFYSLDTVLLNLSWLMGANKGMGCDYVGI